MKAICLPRRNRSSSWAFCSVRLTLFLKCEFWTIFFRAEAIFASSISKVGNRWPSVDCDVFRSSTESTISPSLIQCTASEVKLELEHTSVLKLVFQYWKCRMVREFIENSFSRPDSSVVQPYNFADKFLQIWLLKCCIPLPTNRENPKRMCRETCCVTHHQENKPRTRLRLQFSTTILTYPRSMMFPQTWRLLTLVLCFTFVKIMKRWSRWSSKAEVQQWDTYPEPTELRLIGYLREPTCTQRSKSNTLTPKNQLADIMAKGNFTCAEWNHLLHLFNIGSFSSASCPETMSKIMLEEKGEEMIVAKSKPTLNLVS